MRVNMLIDDALIKTALEATGLPTKRAVIAEALRLLVRLKSQEEIRSLRGQLQCEGNLHRQPSNPKYE